MEATLNTFMKATDQRFQDMQQDMNKRFEQVDKRFEQMMNFMWILASIFTAITVITIGFALWDRRTMVRKAVDESVDRIECRGIVAQFIGVIEDLAKENPKPMSILRSRGLL